MKYIKIKIPFACLILASCSTLKNEKLSIKETSQKETLQFDTQHKNILEQQQVVISDSTENEITMVFWPKGRFTFDPSRGFEGEAEKVFFKSKQHNHQRVQAEQQRLLESNTSKTNYTTQKSSSLTASKDKIRVNFQWFWVVGCVLLVFFVIYWRYFR